MDSLSGMSLEKQTDKEGTQVAQASNDRIANVVVATYFVFSAGLVGFLWWNWDRGSPMAAMDNGIALLICAGLALAAALVVAVSLVFIRSRISHFLCLMAVVAGWLGFVVQTVRPEPRIDYSVRVANASKNTITVDTRATFGHPVTTNDFWTLRSGDQREWGGLSAKYAPRSVSVKWWIGKQKGSDDKVLVTESLQVPLGFGPLDTLQITIDNENRWSVSVEKFPSKIRHTTRNVAR